jgi:hypothetical protein
VLEAGKFILNEIPTILDAQSMYNEGNSFCVRYKSKAAHLMS